MLHPTNRLTLIEAMRPPAAYRLESAMAVTFTLNLQALLAAPAAFAIATVGDTTTDATTPKPVELIHALRTNAHKLTVFSEAGEISLPPASRAFAFLERAVVPVQAPRGGIVHPKVWVLRYEASGNSSDGHTAEQRLRVLIASRNLTFDESWDTVLRLDETASHRGVSLDVVGQLFTRLISTTVGVVGKEHLDRVRSLSQALQTARFELPAGVDDLKIHLLGLDEAPSPLPNNAERSLIISPYLTEDFFRRSHPTPVNKLVSRQESLDGLPARTLDSIQNKYIFDDGGTFEYTDAAGGRTSVDDDKKPHGAAPPTPSPADPGRPLVGLHAKVFAFEMGHRAHLFVGSANATWAGFNRNVEILAELRGPVAELGIDRLIAGDGDEPGLRELFHPYRRCVPPRPNGPNGNGYPHLTRARRAIARLPIEGSVEKSGDDWAVTYRSAEPVPPIDCIEIHCWPLTSTGNRRRITPAEPFKECFETSIERMTGFLAFELRHDSGEQTDFVVPVPLEGVPEHRDQHLLKLLIGNAERFLRYLLALLYEDSTQVDLSAVITSIDNGQSSANSSVSLAVLERLLTTMRRDPSKLLGLHPLVADLKADDALPAGFAELWDAIHQVAVEEAGTR